MASILYIYRLNALILPEIEEWRDLREAETLSCLQYQSLTFSYSVQSIVDVVPKPIVSQTAEDE